jgi:branched-subunit amino acid aminotransferase/4-amino-4-deoxychorismate lyase
VRAELNGRTVDPEAAHLALGSHAHFTAMQVRAGATRGLAYHLARLDCANRELFGVPVDADRTRELIRHALAGQADASVRVYIYGTGESILVTVRDPAGPPDSPQRLRSVPYLRPLAHLKYLGGFGYDDHRRRARQDGFDDVLLTGPDGAVAEGGISNVAVLAGSTVVWPDAPHLRGITMQILEAGLADRGLPVRHAPVRLTDLAGFDGMVVTNSHGVAAVDRVDDLPVPVPPEFLKPLVDIYEAAPWKAV